VKISLFSVQDHYPERERPLGQFYAETMEQCILADELGFDTFFLAEHHFHEYGTSPNPAVFLAALAQRTQRIRLGTAVSVLPFRNPLLVAEDYAMLDQLSNGRVTLGVGSGYLQHEFDGFGIPGQEKRARFDEALDLLRRALSGERITHHSDYYDFDGVAINVLPVQKPHPPIYVAILRSEAAYYVGRNGQRMMSVPYASFGQFDEIGGMVAAYQKGTEESSAADKQNDMVLAFHTYVAESDEAARAEAAAAFNLYVDTRLYARRQTYDDIMESGLSLFGSPETVANKMMALQEMGVRHISLLYNFGLLDHQLVLASIRHMATEVMPRIIM
jgi:alkanesulfonate monooxygenase SsuD/methylene tetrahydromethanopterin reductase-like flavin-dependent oxidoreductase (luciferase family)